MIKKVGKVLLMSCLCVMFTGCAKESTQELVEDFKVEPIVEVASTSVNIKPTVSEMTTETDYSANWSENISPDNVVENPVITDSIEGEWSSGVIAVDDNTMKVPCYVSDIEALGFSTSSIDVDYIEAYDTPEYSFTKDDITLHCTFGNFTDTDITVKDCPIFCIRTSSVKVKVNTVSVGEEWYYTENNFGNFWLAYQSKNCSLYRYTTKDYSQFLDIICDDGKHISEYMIYCSQDTVNAFYE